MKTIWKFEIPLVVRVAVAMPAEARIVHVGLQAGKICAWAEVETEAPRATRVFQIVGTGHVIPAAVVHLASVLDGAFVWHVYEERA